MDVRKVLEGLTLEEKRALLEDLREAIARELDPGRPEPDRCPWCGCAERSRKGRDRDGARRWLCKGCGRTFSAKSMGVLAYSKLPPESWMSFAECEADLLTLRDAAARVGVCLSTAWFMRMRVHEVMASRLQPFRARSRSQVDGTYLPESFSGNHRGAFGLPRAAHRNGRDARRGGRVRLSVCVLCGANDLGDAFARLASRGKPSGPDLFFALEGAVGEGSLVETDGWAGYRRELPALGAAHAEAPSRRLAMVNSLHSRLKGFLARFRGVSTRRLQGYLDCFCYREQHRSPQVDRRELIYLDECEGSYLHTRRALADVPRPFVVDWYRTPELGGLKGTA